MVLVNNRTYQTYHGGATASTANVNGVAHGGLVSGAIQYGKDKIVRSSGDNQILEEVDVFINFVRGTITSQDWPDVISLLTGTVGTYIFYEKESGLATVTKNTLNLPVIHRADFSLTNFSPAQITWGFECRGTLNDDVITDMWGRLKTQVAPAVELTTSRGDKITAAVHGVTAIQHVTGLTFSLNANLVIGTPGDGDTCYVAVDLANPFSFSGSITTQDLDSALSLNEIGTPAALAVTVHQMSQAAAKTITFANVLFGSNSANLGQGHTGYTIGFIVNSPSATPLTLATAVAIA